MAHLFRPFLNIQEIFKLSLMFFSPAPLDDTLKMKILPSFLNRTAKNKQTKVLKKLLQNQASLSKLRSSFRI